ncbi:SDR family oxidoreductase [Duganella vulcania]|uniref:SDR family oxidoreductase n=1 Tax=Duganella vulcania TaxID=2692166 RepID=UPI0035A3CCDB
MTKRFEHHNVFVAGGTSGINLGIAVAFANAGARVAVLGRDEGRVAVALERLRATGGDVQGHAGDVRDAPRIAEVLSQVRCEWGLRRSGAALLSITAAQSWLPMAAQAHVCAAKAGIDQLTRTLALEWGPHGVRVNAIAPGPIEDTEGMRRMAHSEASRAAWTRAVPLRRFGSTADIAGAALWLCSAEAGYVTGAVVPVDGGVAPAGAGVLTQAMTQ